MERVKFGTIREATAAKYCFHEKWLTSELSPDEFWESLLPGHKEHVNALIHEYEEFPTYHSKEII